MLPQAELQNQPTEHLGKHRKNWFEPKPIAQKRHWNRNRLLPAVRSLDGLTEPEMESPLKKRAVEGKTLDREPETPASVELKDVGGSQAVPISFVHGVGRWVVIVFRVPQRSLS
jgi:hypothetical protein